MPQPDAASAFAWWPPLDSWLDQLAPRVECWTPHPTLGLDRGRIVRAALDGVELRESWLWHPSVKAVDSPTGGGRAQLKIDAQFAVWVAANSNVDLGTIAMSEPTRLWFPSGTAELRAGAHSLRDLGNNMSDLGPSEIAVDVWCDSVAAAPPGSWAIEPPREDSAVEELERQLTRYLMAVEWLSKQMPQCYAWAAEVVKVVVPLRGGEGLFRSGSSPDLPGVVQLDLLNELQILEGLVHEAAHLHLFRAEAAAALVDPNDDARFPSPLRPEPRPLRGILLAYHALAYICALYGGVLALAESADQRVVVQCADLRAKAKDAEQVLVAERRRLTPAGRAFVDRAQIELRSFHA